MVELHYRKTLRPIHTRIVLLHWDGYTNKEISVLLNVSPATVSDVLNSGPAQEMMQKVVNGTIDTMMEIQAKAQAVAPLALEEKISLALEDKDPRIRSTNCKDLLEMAGHRPVERISIERPDPVGEKYKEKTEQEIREELLRELSGEERPAGTTYH